MSRLTHIFALLCCCCVYVGADDVESAKTKVCASLENTFAEKNVEFERCIMQHAVTENFCVKCLTMYVEQFQAYEKLLTAREQLPDNANKLCGAEVSEKDHFGIFQSHSMRSKDIWTRARCTKCFNCDPESVPYGSNITDVCPVKNGVSDLLDSVENTEQCFTGATGDICKECAHPYAVVISKYHLQKATSGGDTCFDVKDAVDRVRQMWRDDKCDPDDTSGWSFTSILLLLLITVAIAYGSFRSYKVYRFRRDYLTTAMTNSDRSNNYGMLEDRRDDAEL